MLLFAIKTTNAQYSEYEVKAAYIFNFAKFIEWPPIPYLSTDTIYLAIVGNDPFGIILEKTMIGRQANGKHWKIKRIKKAPEKQEYHIMFISGVEPSEALAIIEKTKKQSVLTIGDKIPQFCELGGIINFTQQYSQNQFEINNHIAKDKGITISPKLLVLSKIITTTEDEF